MMTPMMARTSAASAASASGTLKLTLLVSLRLWRSQTVLRHLGAMASGADPQQGREGWEHGLCVCVCVCVSASEDPLPGVPRLDNDATNWSDPQ